MVPRIYNINYSTLTKIFTRENIYFLFFISFNTKITKGVSIILIYYYFFLFIHFSFQI